MKQQRDTCNASLHQQSKVGYGNPRQHQSYIAKYYKSGMLSK